jgi:hypothetical protein
VCGTGVSLPVTEASPPVTSEAALDAAPEAADCALETALDAPDAALEAALDPAEAVLETALDDAALDVVEAAEPLLLFELQAVRTSAPAAPTARSRVLTVRERAKATMDSRW